ncbi:MAG: hypothetical protein IT293_04475 [Deltaproteobacteria bacterium]|nr:hypothetical protein [Deltaproteobacteria bacterium]
MLDRTFGARVACALGVGMMLGTAPPAHALLGKAQYTCQTAVAKEAIRFLGPLLRLHQACRDANLAAPGSCAAPDSDAVAKLRARLAAGIRKHCDFGALSPPNLLVIGYPGPCPDPDPSNGFIVDDLIACIQGSHESRIGGVCGGGTNLGESCGTLGDCPDAGPGTLCRGLLSVQYDPETTGPLSSSARKCQQTIAKSSSKLLVTIQKSIQKCRSNLLDCEFHEDELVCKLSGFGAADCATADPRTAAAIGKAEQQLRARVEKACAPSDLPVIGICEPDQPTIGDGIDCLIDAIRDIVDNPDPDPGAVPDLGDFVYATAAVCGDRRVNTPAEECDGTSDAACPGQCGDPLGLFACQCADVPRARAVCAHPPRDRGRRRLLKGRREAREGD